MNRYIISVSLILLVSLYTSVWADEMDTLGSGETNKVWRQTAWFGDGEVFFIDE